MKSGKTNHLYSEFLVVGAGISGLMIARQLHDAGRTVRVVEKGRGFGGRMTTRRMTPNARCDHGAQYFTVRDPRFGAWVECWQEAGVIREWFRHLEEISDTPGHPRYVGKNGISDVPKYLADGLSVVRGERVTKLLFQKNHWTVVVESELRYACDFLILTAPVPQALELLTTSDVSLPPDVKGKLQTVRYDKGLAVMALLDGPSGIPGFGGLKISPGPLTWIADNERKGISRDPAVTLQASPAFAETHWDSPDEVRGPLLLESAKPYLSANVLQYVCHRWGYAFPVSTFGSEFFHEPELRLLLAGDGFGGPRVEGAALSGIAAGAHLLENWI